MTTINQSWITIDLLGDVDPFTHGGAFVQVHPDHGFLLSHWEPETKTLYRVDIDTFTYTNNILSDNPYHAGTEEGAVWFNNRLVEIAKTNGLTRRTLVEMFLSPSPTRRAEAIMMVAEHFGWEEFDQYPLKPETPQELRNLKATFERWKKQASSLPR